MAYPGGVSTVTGCAISNNTALTAYGGGAYVHGANAKIKNSRLFNNLASVALGGGVYFSGGGTVENCLLIGNRSGTTMGGNAHFEGGGTMNNCTLSKGSASAGSGARMNGGAMNNCIVWGNNVDDLSVAAGTVSYTCSKVKASGTGNIDTDPRFVNTNAWDFHLRGYSPCVDQGTMLSWTSSSIDLDGRKRINGAVDMGAFEYYSSGTLIFIR